MTCDEFWFTYHQNSRSGHPETAQLIDLINCGCKLVDLEDLLDYVFCQGFIDAKYRSVAYWERNDGCRVKSSGLIEQLVKDGVGVCEQTALRLIVGQFSDLPNDVADLTILQPIFLPHCGSPMSTPVTVAILLV
jgi:hypothetical protein